MTSDMISAVKTLLSFFKLNLGVETEDYMRLKLHGDLISALAVSDDYLRRGVELTSLTLQETQTNKFQGELMSRMGIRCEDPSEVFEFFLGLVAYKCGIDEACKVALTLMGRFGPGVDPYRALTVSDISDKIRGLLLSLNGNCEGSVQPKGSLISNLAVGGTGSDVDLAVDESMLSLEDVQGLAGSVGLHATLINARVKVLKVVDKTPGEALISRADFTYKNVNDDKKVMLLRLSSSHALYVRKLKVYLRDLGVQDAASGGVSSYCITLLALQHLKDIGCLVYKDGVITPKRDAPEDLESWKRTHHYSDLAGASTSGVFCPVDSRLIIAGDALGRALDKGPVDPDTDIAVGLTMIKSSDMAILKTFGSDGRRGLGAFKNLLVRTKITYHVDFREDRSYNGKPMFESTLVINGHTAGIGASATKKESERMAFKNFLLESMDILLETPRS